MSAVQFLVESTPQYIEAVLQTYDGPKPYVVFFSFNLSLCTLYNEYMITKLCITCIFYNQSTDTAALSYRLFHAECPYHLILKIKLLNEVWI